MVRRASLMLAVSAVASSLALGCGGDSCLEPTLAQCQDLVWLETDACGQVALEKMRASAEATCSRLLTEHSQQVTAGYAEEEDLLPPELGGGVGLVTVVPNSEQGLSEINMSLTHVGSAQQAAASATADGLSAQEQALREQWNANGNRIESCREYVYEKYYDYSLFEDAVVSRYSDTRYLAEVVFGPSTELSAIGSRLASSPPKMKDGTPLGGFPLIRTVKAPLPGYLVDLPPASDEGSWRTVLIENVFAALPQELLQPGEREQVEWVAPKTEVNTFDSCSTPELEGGWLWHRTRREELQAQGNSPAELDAMYLKVREFQQLMKAYRAYQVAGTPDCCSSAPAEECCTLHQASGSSLETRLRELFDQAVAEGCLEPGVTRCSWSPAFLVDSLRTTENFSCYHDTILGSFGAAMELDYQACLALTGDDFTQLSAFELQLPDGQSWPPAGECPQFSDWPTCPVGDYSASPAAFDLFVWRQQSYQQAVQAYWAAILAAMPPDVFDRQGQLKAPGLQWSDHHDAGNAKFGVSYDYQLGWELPGVTATAQTIPELCLVGPEAVGSFTAEGWAFGSEPVKAIDAYFKAGLVQDEIEGHLEVLGRRFWVPQDSTAVELLVNSEISLSCGIVRPCPPEDPQKKQGEKCPLKFPFTVAGWPMSLEAGIAGSLGLEPVWEASKASGHARGASCWSFKAGFKPTLGLQAFGALSALDIKVLKAGLSLSLTLVELGLPITWQISETSEVDSVTDHETLRLQVGSGGALAIRLLAGRIAAFLSVGIDPFSVSYSYNIFKWQGIKLPELPLWGSSYSVPLWELLELVRQNP